MAAMTNPAQETKTRDTVVSALLDKAYAEFDQAVNAGGTIDLIAEMKKLWAAGPVVFGVGCEFRDLQVPPVFAIAGMRSALVMDYEGVNQVLREDGFQHAFYPAFGEAGTLIHLNGEPHRRYRQLLTAVFAPRSIAVWEERAVPAVLEALLARLDGKEQVDLLPVFVQPYPAMVFRSIMGLPEEDIDRVRALAILEIAAGADPRLREYVEEMGAYMREKIAERRALPHEELEARPDLISLLVRARAGDFRLGDDEIQSTLQLLITAGVDTTNHGLANTLCMLLTQPEVLEEVKADRSLVPAAIEETLRLVPSGGNFECRQAVRDVVVSGVSIAEGTPVVTCETTANRDPSYWPDPDTFNLKRERKQHLTFATGPHQCIGMHLARMEIRKAVNALLDRFPNLRLDPEAPTPEIKGFMFQHPTALPVLLE